jgi:hypothetical protein
MAKLEACFTKIYVDPRDKTYVFFCTGICDSNVSVEEYNQALQ